MEMLPLMLAALGVFVAVRVVRHVWVSRGRRLVAAAAPASAVVAVTEGSVPVSVALPEPVPVPVPVRPAPVHAGEPAPLRAAFIPGQRTAAAHRAHGPVRERTSA